MRVEIRSVTVIVGGLLEIDAIGFNVAVQLRHQNIFSSHTPARRRSDFRPNCSHIEESECFARQVRVRAKVG